LQESAIDAETRDRAIAIFELLAKAEGRVHGIAAQDVTFHEVGAWDSIADIVGAAYLLAALGPVSWSLSHLPIGGGRVTTAHGSMPVPAPATAELLEGFSMIDDGVDGERVTPTGAAILRHLRETLGTPDRTATRLMTLAGNGIGFGTRVLPGLSNACRILCFELADTSVIEDRVGEIRFEVDDQTPEDLAIGIDVLRTHADVLDIIQIPAVGKKGRMIFQIQVLCRREALGDVIDACFTETTTLGLRFDTVVRAKLRRDRSGVGAGGTPVAVKLARRPGGALTAKAEAEDLKSIRGYDARQRARADAEEEARRTAESDDSCLRK
jgi:hypothetical protein